MADPAYGLGGSNLEFDSPTQEEVIPQFLKECSLNGHYYALPYMRSTEACYINQDYVEQLGGRAIWLSCCFLLVSFTLMFIREELEENPVIEKDLTAIRQETREIDRTLKQELQEEQRELTQSTRK